MISLENVLSIAHGCVNIVPKENPSLLYKPCTDKKRQVVRHSYQLLFFVCRSNMAYQWLVLLTALLAVTDAQTIINSFDAVTAIPLVGNISTIYDRYVQ
jgi:hypothetical protein